MQKTLRTLELKKTIGAQIDTICEMIKDENKQHRTELNNELEDIFEFILNAITPNGNFKNLNLGTEQEPGIDLGDVDKKICYQITSEGTSSKVQDCLKKFNTHKLYKKYDHLIILFANDYKPDLTKFTFNPKYSFKPLEIATTVNKHQLQADIEKTGIDILEKIADYLERQLADYINSPSKGVAVINDILDACQEEIEKEDGKINIDQSVAIKVRKKIELNFEDEDDADQMTDYMQDALRHSTYITSIINSRIDLDPADLELYIKDMYNKIKHKQDSPMLTMLALFEGVIPGQKGNDLAYITWARRFILKYFEDCSIFKKTKEEKGLVVQDVGAV